MTDVLHADGLHRSYRLPRRGPFEPGPVRTAVDGVDLTVAPGARLGIVGESGSGKSTLVRLLAGLEAPSAGTVTASGRPVVASGSAAAMRWFRRETGVVFQDPYASLDPRMRVGSIVAEPLRALRIGGSAAARASLVRDVLERVDLPADAVDRYPHEFSGGQRQRIAIARAVVHSPRILFGDEPMSALDVVVRARVIDLFRSLADDLGLTLVLVSHDIGVVQRLCDTVAVMSAGRIVEHGPVSLLDAPQHPVTRALVEAAPTLP
ncbi:ABC transporter ATP-binding protein [Curtobacterium pusillum]|uniref:ABC transporter ATP-binding protein n=1 Tax=Curtobacterium pusillum TaxID=69373 RepID=A0AAW3T741_9MICO|nr:ABC transporter ATP-binding protein [Curtobacterium pusillum]MBA8990570.1 peptide/nickel transport system ATP-binding protein [Curtobacterium pusillum]NUU12526.1 ABC transporter ATP-binding protein [Curtobacterium pusillum]GLK29869.1 ABC transporter ATP-binding protein [Curtobacterium pusillum]